jgi:4-diphosphocytidyl-2-C-methyl-D-erythritol kinase
VVVFPNCKINLGLNVIQRREDGFHNIETVFYPVAWQDGLEIMSTLDAAGNIQFSASGQTITGETEANLCIRAYQLLKQDFPQLPAIKMHLHKTIPIGAGLGGGSGDGAFTLRLLDKLFTLGLPKERLMQYALDLGSDCPFFIFNQPCFATSRGEVLEAIELDLSAYKLIIVSPGIHINTAQAFSMVNPVSPSKSIKQIAQQPLETWGRELKNDFEQTVFEQYPEIRKIKDDLYKAGALYAAMSGTGSTVYGIFPKNKELSFSFPLNYFVKTILI